MGVGRSNVRLLTGRDAADSRHAERAERCALSNTGNRRWKNCGCCVVGGDGPMKGGDMRAVHSKVQSWWVCVEKGHCVRDGMAWDGMGWECAPEVSGGKGQGK